MFFAHARQLIEMRTPSEKETTTYLAIIEPSQEDWQNPEEVLNRLRFGFVK